MNHPNNFEQKKSNEVFDLILIFWGKKKLLLLILIFGAILSYSYHYNQSLKKQVIIDYDIMNESPLRDKSHIDNILVQLFYSEDNFNEWIALKKEASISYSDISKTVEEESVKFRKSSDNMLVLFNLPLERKIILKTTDLKIITDVFDYINFINRKITISEIRKTKFLLSQKQSITGNESKVFSKDYLQLFSYQKDLELGGLLLTISNPTRPQVSNPNLLASLLIFTFVVTFGVVGIIIWKEFKDYLAFKNINK